MAACDACKMQEGKGRRDAPHAALQLVDTKKHTGAMAIGAVFTYRCTACGSELKNDDDRNDPGAGWWIDKEG